MRSTLIDRILCTVDSIALTDAFADYEQALRCHTSLRSEKNPLGNSLLSGGICAPVSGQRGVVKSVDIDRLRRLIDIGRYHNVAR